MESILTSVKKVLGIDEEYKQFDLDIIMHINSVFGILHQLGIGPEDGFAISDDSASWEDFYDTSNYKLEMIRSYVYLKTRLMFDPPTSSAAMEAANHMISELEWRLNVAVDPEV